MSHSSSDSSSSRSSNDSDTSEKIAQLDSILSTVRMISTNHIIHKHFRSLATKQFTGNVKGESNARGIMRDGHQAIDVEGVRSMGPRVLADLKISNLGLDNDDFLRVSFERFDFNGQGLLGKVQCTKLFRKLLQCKRNQLGGRGVPVELPFTTLEDKGYNVEKELGRGGQGVMYLCSKADTDEPYCIKFYEKSEEGSNTDLDDVIEEYALMKEFSNPHVAQTYEAFQDNQYYYLVNQPYFGGDLTKLAKRANDEGVRMSEGWLRGIFVQCLDGLLYLHKKTIMHCDIKEENIMIKDESGFQAPQVVLIDFGLCQGYAASHSGACGTPGYIPPETYDTGRWYPRGDVFSMGVTFFQITIGQVPGVPSSVGGVLQTAGSSARDAAAARQVDTRLPWERFPSDMPHLRQLLEKMLKSSRFERPYTAAALEFPWFKSTSDANLPEESIVGLLGTSEARLMKDKLVEDLIATNNLQELRAQANGGGRSPTDSAASLEVFRAAVQEAMNAKARYNSQFVKDLFDQLDTDNSGTLSVDEIEGLLRTEAFHDEVDDDSEVNTAATKLLEEMDKDGDGQVTYEEFRHAVLKDGRVVTRPAAASALRKPLWCHRCVIC